MEIDKTSKSNQNTVGEKRMNEIKSSIYLERLEQLFTIIEVSYILNTANRISFQKRIKFY